MGIIVFAIVVILIVTYKLYMRSGKEKIDNDVNNLDEKQNLKIRLFVFVFSMTNIPLKHFEHVPNVCSCLATTKIEQVLAVRLALDTSPMLLVLLPNDVLL